MPATLSTGDSIATGPDGNLWFTVKDDAAIARMTTDGMFDRFDLPDGEDRPLSITSGPDGNVWFTVYADKIGRITPTGSIVEYSVTENSRPSEIIDGMDGNLWFTQSNWNGLGRISVDGAFHQFGIYAFHGFDALVATEDDAIRTIAYEEIARVTRDGEDERFPLSFPSSPRSLVLGPEQRLWFAAPERPSLASMDLSGQVDELSLPDGSAPYALVAAPDGALWFSEPTRSRVVRVSRALELEQLDVPDPASRPGHMTVGPDGAVWFVDGGMSAIVRIDP